MSSPRGRTGLALAGLVACLGAAPAAAAPPPSPWELLGSGLLRTPSLDATRVCVPEDLPPEAASARAHLAAGRLAAALGALREVDPDPGSAAESLSTILRARRARTRGERLTALGELERAGVGAERSCLELEAARLELELSRFPEAAARAQRALRGAAEALAPRARFLRAEGLYLSGWLPEADALYRELARLAPPELAAAARLRVADVIFDAGDRASVSVDYAALLGGAQELPGERRAWALRAAEAAFAAGRPGDAEAWLRRYLDLERARDATAAAELRLADVEAALGRELESRARFERVERLFDRLPAAGVAVARRVELGLDERPHEERVASLQGATHSPRPAVRLYAAAVLGRELARAAALEPALGVLTRALTESPPESIALALREELVAVLGGLGERARAAEDPRQGCLALVRQLGGRYRILAHHLADPQPLVALGLCYETLGLPAVAQTTYRALLELTDGRAADAVALPSARASRALGESAAVRVAAAANLRRAGERAPEWLLLLAQVELRDGQRTRALDLARGLVEAGQPAGRRAEALEAFAAALAAGDEPPARADLELLTRQLEALPEALRSGEPAEAGFRFGHAALLAGEAWRGARRTRRARPLYELAARVLPPGVGRAHAGYWAAALARDRRAAGETLRQVAAAPVDGAWPALAGLELQLEPLRELLEGREPR